MRFRQSSKDVLRTVILIVFFLSSSYFVVQVHASEPSLIDIFNHLGFTNTSETSVETFSAGTYNITLYAEFAGYSDENELSYYEVDTSIFNVIFTGPEGGYEYLSPPTTKTFTADYQFGLSMLSPGPHRYFSETSENPDGEQHAKVYRNLDDPDMFLIGFENQYGAGDRDYNDMVFSLECAHDLTVSAGVGGSTVPDPGVYTHPCDSSVLVEAVPDACYTFDHWLLDGGNVGSVNPYSVLMDDDHSLHAVFAQVDYTLTITATAGGTTDPIPGVYSYHCGSSVSVEAVPDSCYVFDHWLLDTVDVGSVNPYSVLMDDDHALHAVFTQISYDLTVSAGVGGTSSPVPGTYSHACGSSVDITAIPDEGYRFDHWMLDGSPAGSANPISVLMSDNHDLEAVFAETHTLIITVSEGGTTDPSPGTYTYDAATNVVVEAVPSVGYLFDYWEFDGEDIGSENPITVYVGSSHALKAFFTPITCQLTITTTSGGTTSPVPGTYTYDYGSYVSVTAIPDSCYVFDHWLLDTVDVGAVNPYCVLMDDDRALNAVFTYSSPSLSVSINPPSASIVVGDSVSFTSTKSGGTSPYTYQWYLNDASVSGATSSNWIFTPSSTGTHDVYLKVTDACNTIAQSGTTQVTVRSPSSAPVGGYSVSLTRPVAKTPLICYAMLLAIFGLATGLIRRKRK